MSFILTYCLPSSEFWLSKGEIWIRIQRASLVAPYWKVQFVYSTLALALNTTPWNSNFQSGFSYYWVRFRTCAQLTTFLPLLYYLIEFLSHGFITTTTTGIYFIHHRRMKEGLTRAAERWWATGKSWTGIKPTPALIRIHCPGIPSYLL